MTKAEARAWKRRWRLVNEAVTKEARAATPEDRLRDLEMLFALAHSLGGPDDDKGVAEVRCRWLRLKELACG